MVYGTLHNKRNGYQHGFTLIELSIVLVISGVLMIAAIRAYQVYDAKQRFETTRNNQAYVENALNDFVEVNGRLPCAAPRNVERTDAAYGREVDCSAAAGSGTVRTSGQGGKNVRIGMLPARTLGIADEYMVDGNRYAFLYAVTEDLTVEENYAHDGGAIDVLDGTGTSKLAAVSYAQYILISPGSSGYGAYTAQGQSYQDCDTDRLEGENCDDDGVFVETDLARGDVASFYDDRTLYKHRLPVVVEQTPPTCEQKTGFTVKAARCPDGWKKNDFVTSNVLSNPRNGLATGTVGEVYNERADGSGYYFTAQKTSETVDLGYKVFPTPGWHDVKTIYCQKEGDNTMQNSCFTETLNIYSNVDAGRYNGRNLDESGFNTGVPNATDLVEGCPPGFHKTNVSIDKTITANDSDGNRNSATGMSYTETYNGFKITCSK